VAINDQPMILPANTVLMMKPRAERRDGDYQVTYNFLIKPLEFSPEDLEFLNARDFESNERTEQEIYEFFGLSPHLLNVPSQIPFE
jgi:hypothetical protein